MASGQAQLLVPHARDTADLSDYHRIAELSEQERQMLNNLGV